MKKYLPLIILFIGVLVVLAAIFFVTRKKSDVSTDSEEEVSLIEVSPSDRPVLSLTPRSDGHWLDMKVSKLKRFEAFTMDYELLYKLPDGRTQGVPGTIRMDSVSNGSVERELLLGSESSGNFRYDEGVEDGSLTLRFRDEKGRLLIKFVSDFKLLSNTRELKSVDGSVIYILNSIDKNYYVVMDTIGYLGDAPGELEREPFAILSSSSAKVSGTIEKDNLYLWNDGWTEITGKSSDVGFFIQTK